MEKHDIDAPADGNTADDLPVAVRQARWNSLTDVANERLRQVKKGYDTKWDANHNDFDLSRVAACYALFGCPTTPGAEAILDEFLIDIWAWEDHPFSTKTRRENLIRAAALLVAEIDRIDSEMKNATS